MSDAWPPVRRHGPASGTSPPQVGAYFGARFLEHYWADAAADAWALGDYEAWAARLALEVVWSNVAFYYWATAREEWDGTTVGFSGPGLHSDMHEPGVWYSLPWGPQSWLI